MNKKSYLKLITKLKSKAEYYGDQLQSPVGNDEIEELEKIWEKARINCSITPYYIDFLRVLNGIA